MARTGESVLGAEVRPGIAPELRDQIALRVVEGIRAGRYRSGHRLPSVRRVAVALGVHRETARGAYARLREEGWVRVRPGSGAYVASALDPEGIADGDPVRRLLLDARRDGASRAEVAARLERWRRALDRRTVTVVGPDRATAGVWAAELDADLAAVGARVEGTTLTATIRPGILAAAPPELGELTGTLPGCSELFALRPGPGPGLRRFLAGLPYGSVVLLLSESRRIRLEVTCYAEVVRGHDVAVVASAPGDEGLERALSVARFVLADVTCRGREIPLPPETEARCFRHLDRRTAQVLAAYLGPGRDES